MTDLELKQFNGVYYIHNYIPIRRFPFYSFEEQLISQKLWGYKNYDLNAIEYFTSDLYDAINKILFIDPPFKRYIGLISVPTSSATKSAPMCTCIERICERWNETASYIRFYDYSSLLYRTESIRPSHKCARGRKPTLDDQYKTIECDHHRLWKFQTAFILMDDIITSGTTIDACEAVLRDHDEDDYGELKIYKLAIAHTV